MNMKCSINLPSIYMLLFFKPFKKLNIISPKHPHFTRIMVKTYISKI